MVHFLNTLNPMPRVVISIADKTPQPYRFDLDREKVTIGRSSSSDIVIDCPSVSGLHCTMERVDGGFILKDQGSTNGLKLNDEEMEIIDLRNDIDVFVGDAEFEYTLSDEELDDLDEEDFVPHARKASERKESKKAPDTDDFEDEDEKPRKKKKALKTPPRAAAPPPPQPVLSSTTGNGNGFFVLGAIICGFLALYAGLDASYRGSKQNEDREDSFSLISDMWNGAPAPTESKEEEE